MANKIIKISILLILLIFAGCSKHEKDVVKVNSSKLSSSEFLEQVPQEFRKKISREQWYKIANDWADEELLSNYAIKKGAFDNPDIKRRIEQAKKNILIDYLRQEILAKNIEINDEIISQYYNNNQGEFVREQTEVRALHILTTSKETVDSVKKFLSDSIAFCQIAIKYSDSYSPTDSCDLGWFTKQELLPELVSKVFNAKPNDVVGPLKSVSGYHFFYIIDNQGSETLKPLREVKQEIRQLLFTQQLTQQLTRTLDSLRNYSELIIDSSRIDSLIPNMK